MNALVPAATQLPPGALTTAEMAATMSYAKEFLDQPRDPYRPGAALIFVMVVMLGWR